MILWLVVSALPICARGSRMCHKNGQSYHENCATLTRECAMKVDLKNITHYALVVGIAFTALSPSLAQAATAANIGTGVSAASTNLTQTMANLQAQTSSVPNVISWFCYIVGVSFAAFGIFKLKQHADNAAQNKLGPALGVLTTGAAFLALPGLANAIAGTNKYAANTTRFVDNQF